MMKSLSIILVVVGCVMALNLKAQSPSAQSFVYAGYPAIGFDYAKKINPQKWSSLVVSLAASPGFYFRKYNFDLGSSTSKYLNYRILLPITLRFHFYPNQILLSDIGKKKAKLGVFLDAGYCVSYNLATHLTENFFTNNSTTPVFTYNGDLEMNSNRISFHPTVGFGMKFNRVLFFFRTIIKPYHGKDLSKGWNLPEGSSSYFYSWEYSQPGVMLCLGYTL
jgi:hypothetical protein